MVPEAAARRAHPPRKSLKGPPVRMRRQGKGQSKHFASERRRDAPRRPTQTVRHSKQRRQSVSKGAAPSIVGEEKVNAPVNSIQSCAG